MCWNYKPNCIVLRLFATYVFLVISVTSPLGGNS